MTVEHLAVLGIVIFGFMAVMNLFSALRTFKRSRRNNVTRVRRLIGGPDAAMALARSVAKNIFDKYTDGQSPSREMTEELERALEEGRQYYTSRVESIHRELFTKAIDELIGTPPPPVE